MPARSRRHGEAAVGRVRRRHRVPVSGQASDRRRGRRMLRRCLRLRLTRAAMRRRLLVSGLLRGAGFAASVVAAVTVPVMLSAPALAAPALAAVTRAADASAQVRTGPGQDQANAQPVVLVGIPGLRWTDVSPGATPSLWRLAGQGSPGTLVTRAVLPHTCPADEWLTLNAGARAMSPHANKGPCPPVPAPAALPAIAFYNQHFHYNARWGLLAAAAGPAGCVTAAGPGAALALATSQGVAPPQVPVARVSRLRCLRGARLRWRISARSRPGRPGRPGYAAMTPNWAG